MTVFDVFTVVFVLLGIFFFFSGSVGLLRFPNAYARLHALTKVDNLGIGFIAIGVLPQLDHSEHVLQALLVWGLVMISGAAGAYLIARHLRRKGAE